MPGHWDDGAAAERRRAAPDPRHRDQARRGVRQGQQRAARRRRGRPRAAHLGRARSRCTPWQARRSWTSTCRDGVAAPASVTGYTPRSGPRSLGRLHRLHSIGRGRTLQLVAVVVCRARAHRRRHPVLLGTPRAPAHRADHRHPDPADHGCALALLHRVTDTRRAPPTSTRRPCRAQRDGARTPPRPRCTPNLDQTRADTTAAEVGAFTSGAQANNLAACLTGVSQALNQLAVGDGGAISSLQAVDGAVPDGRHRVSPGRTRPARRRGGGRRRGPRRRVPGRGRASSAGSTGTARSRPRSGPACVSPGPRPPTSGGRSGPPRCSARPSPRSSWMRTRT